MHTHRTRRSSIDRALNWSIWGVLAVLGGIVGYLLVLAGSALRSWRMARAATGAPRHRFAVLIPAHNEELLLPDLLRSLAAQLYPHELFEIHVVADNCTDQTAQVARGAGAVAHERFNQELVGKGHALQWLIDRLIDLGRYDAYVILDADSVVSVNFLAVMDRHLAQGARAIQAYYAVRDPDRSWSVAMRYAALAALHYLRPLGRTALGGSAGLKGNGMVFAADILRRQRWSGALTEDIEFHVGLVLGQERVVFAPEAVVEAEMPDSLSGSSVQNERWERGRIEMAKRFALPLLRKGLAEQRFAPIDTAAELLIPPFSTLTGASVVALVAAIALPGNRKPRGVIAVAILVGQAIYLLTSLVIARAPRKVYLSLIYAPFFVLWKMQLYLRVLLGRGRSDWVRTARNAAVQQGDPHVKQ
jgi:cellulose synthase/poly-beta-1,6-N-acetylglucosamine synthase-like glycosyltransferase